MLTELRQHLQRLVKRYLAKKHSKTIPDALRRSTLRDYPFLTADPANDPEQLRALVGEFLADKEFNGVHGLQITDAMAVAIAAQACLPVLYLGLQWYDDFKGIVVHPGAMLARREVVDDAGVVHYYKEALSGEAMQHGPVTLSWADVAASGDSAQAGYNVVIHEFTHFLDHAAGPWRSTGHPALQAEYELLCAAVERGEPTLIDPYGAEDPMEFLAVAAETFFELPLEMREQHPALYGTLRGLFALDPAAWPERD